MVLLWLFVAKGQACLLTIFGHFFRHFAQALLKSPDDTLDEKSWLRVFSAKSAEADFPGFKQAHKTTEEYC